MVKNARIYRFNELVKMMGNKDSVTLAFNTVAHRISDNKIGIRLHSTDVVVVGSDDTYSLYTNDWRTVTTKDRINGFSPARVIQKNFEWFVDGEIPFYEGITVNAYGEVIPQF